MDLSPDDGAYVPCNTEPCTVLDPFFGSGTAGIVAHKHGRKFVGIELSEAYLKDIAIPRIEKETKQLKQKKPHAMYAKVFSKTWRKFQKKY